MSSNESIIETVLLPSKVRGATVGINEVFLSVTVGINEVFMSVTADIGKGFG